MGKLKKTDKLFLTIIYVLWELLFYYRDFFSLEIPDDPTRLSVKLSYYEDNITHIIVETPSTRDPDPYYKGDSMKTIFNEYLNVVLLPQYPELKPFAGGSSRYDLVDCIYVDRAYVLTNGYSYIDFIYVDNMQAFRHVKDDMNIKKI